MINLVCNRLELVCLYLEKKWIYEGVEIFIEVDGSNN